MLKVSLHLGHIGLGRDDPLETEDHRGIEVLYPASIVGRGGHQHECTALQPRGEDRLVEVILVVVDHIGSLETALVDAVVSYEVDRLALVNLCGEGDAERPYLAVLGESGEGNLSDLEELALLGGKE